MTEFLTDPDFYASFSYFYSWTAVDYSRTIFEDCCFGDVCSATLDLLLLTDFYTAGCDSSAVSNLSSLTGDFFYYKGDLLYWTGDFLYLTGDFIILYVLKLFTIFSNANLDFSK